MASGFALIGFAALLGLSTASADSILSATGSFSAVPSGFPASTGPWIDRYTAPATHPSMFWNNSSIDSMAGDHQMNVGDLLMGDGCFSGAPSILGSDSVSSSLMAAGGGDPSAFSFIRNATAYNVSLLFADSTLDTGHSSVGTVFGYYTGDSFHPLYTVGVTTSPTGTQSFDPTALGGTYGFYATVCYAVGHCETYTTGNGNWGNDAGGAGWNHFALFQTASGNYAIGFEDANGMFGEGLGDFNDAVIELTTAPVSRTTEPLLAGSVPEPGSIALIGLSLGALLLARRRALR